jgi:hypothetical protein
VQIHEDVALPHENWAATRPLLDLNSRLAPQAAAPFHHAPFREPNSPLATGME